MGENRGEPLQVLIRLTVVIVSTAVAVALGEVGLRTVGIHGQAPPVYRYDPELGWALVAEAHEWVSGFDTAVWVDTDALGLRTQPVSGADRTQTTGGILILGDSFAFGWGVPADRMLSYDLEQDLAADHRWLPVRTAGVPGYGTDQELLAWRRLAPALAPRVVVLLFHPSDFGTNVASTVSVGTSTYGKPRFVIDGGELRLTGVPVAQKQVSFDLWDSLKRPFRGLAVYEVGRLALARFHSSASADPGAEPAEESWRVTARLFEALKEDVAAHSARLLIVATPTTTAVGGRLAALCRSLAIPFLDLNESFQAHPDFRLAHDGHWNAQGHALAAERVARALRPLM